MWLTINERPAAECRAKKVDAVWGVNKEVFNISVLIPDDVPDDERQRYVYIGFLRRVLEELEQTENTRALQHQIKVLQSKLDSVKNIVK